jgi:hypothetical protein
MMIHEVAAEIGVCYETCLLVASRDVGMRKGLAQFIPQITMMHQLIQRLA